MRIELNYNQEMRTRSRNYALKKTPNDATAVHFVTSMSTSTRFGSAGPVASTRHRDISLSVLNNCVFLFTNKFKFR